MLLSVSCTICHPELAKDPRLRRSQQEADPSSPALREASLRAEPTGSFLRMTLRLNWKHLGGAPDDVAVGVQELERGVAVRIDCRQVADIALTVAQIHPGGSVAGLGSHTGHPSYTVVSGSAPKGAVADRPPATSRGAISHHIGLAQLCKPE